MWNLLHIYVIAYFHIYVIAYLHICIFAYLHIFIFTYLHICIFSYHVNILQSLLGDSNVCDGEIFNHNKSMIPSGNGYI